MRKLISFDDETYASPLDLRDALRKSVKAAGEKGGRRITDVRGRVPKKAAPARALKRKAG
ncbi:MAG: hypothetical protein HY242_03485 [Afipia sp.]|nr:hypothetical protein [Afipia sp.]